MFANVMDHLDGPLAADLVQEGILDYDRAKRCVWQLGVVKAAPCTTHGTVCLVPWVVLDVSGSPCPPWSTARRRSLVAPQEHPDTLLLLVWARVLREDRPYMAVHENVMGFQVSVMTDLVGDLYDIRVCCVGPEQVGFSIIRRPRL